MRIVGALLLFMDGSGCGGRSEIASTAGGGGTSQSTDDASTPAMTGEDASCNIAASNYDQSCAVDTDCRMISAGDYCVAGCLCGGSAIHATALAQFNADVAKTPLGSGAVQELACNCPQEFAPCCRQGQCVAGSDCLPAGPSTGSSASGSTTSSAATGSAQQTWTGPLNATISCALYDDGACTCDGFVTGSYHTILCSNTTDACICSIGSLLSEQSLVLNTHACPPLPAAGAPSLALLNAVWATGCQFPLQ
jgi:hypothetical protein